MAFSRVWVRLAAALTCLVLAWTAASAAVAAPLRYAVYFEGEPTHQSRLAATLAANLLGRFGIAELRDIGDYRPGEIGSYAGAVVLADRAQAVPAEVLAAAAAGRSPVILVRLNAQPLLGRSARALGLMEAATPGLLAASVSYKGRPLTRDVRSGPLGSVQLIDGGPARVLAEARDAQGRSQAWAVRTGALTYIAESPLSYVSERDRYLVFADLLFDAFAPATPERHRALVRIEDVGPEADPARLRRIADVLWAKRAPFSVAVYDTYADPFGRFSGGRPRRVTLADRPAVVAALRYMEARGGVLVMHGHTHQSDGLRNPFDAVSGGDYEFIRARVEPDGAFRTLGPLPDDTTPRWLARIDEGLKGWRAVALPEPFAFTTPHYAATPAAYAAIRQRLPIRYERSLYFADDDPAEGAAREDQFFPFEVLDARGDVILPENLGYVSETGAPSGPYGGQSGEAVVAAAETERVVRDGFASFFFHWYEDPDILGRIVSRIQGLGYVYVSPREVMAAAPAHLREAVARRVPIQSAPVLVRPTLAAPAPSPWLLINLAVAAVLLCGLGALALDPHLRRLAERRRATVRIG
jgi:uncharacterized protein YdaL